MYDIITTLYNSIISNVGPLKSAPDNWLTQNCKMCHYEGQGKDTRSRFGIRRTNDTISLHCFNCGFSTRYTEGGHLTKKLKLFLKTINVSPHFIRQIEFDIFKNGNKITQLYDGGDTPSTISYHRWAEKPLPEDSMTISEWLENGLTESNFLQCVEYLKRRNIHKFDDFYWTPSTVVQLNKRIIIPYKYKGINVGYTARLSYKNDDKSIPRYYQQCPDDFVFNLDNQDAWNRKFVIVNEGVFDAWTVDGVATLGAINQPKIDIINNLNKKIIVCPDSDSKGYSLVKAAIDNKWAVSFPKWEKTIKDAAQAAEKYGRLLTTHAILDSAVTGADKILLMWKIHMQERNKIRAE